MNCDSSYSCSGSLINPPWLRPSSAFFRLNSPITGNGARSRTGGGRLGLRRLLLRGKGGACDFARRFCSARQPLARSEILVTAVYLTLDREIEGGDRLNRVARNALLSICYQSV